MNGKPTIEFKQCKEGDYLVPLDYSAIFEVIPQGTSISNKAFCLKCFKATHRSNRKKGEVVFDLLNLTYYGPLTLVEADELAVIMEEEDKEFYQKNKT